MDELLAAAADVNSRSADGSTPLHQAAYHGYELCCKTLMAAGADVNAKTANGKTPLDLAVMQARHKVVSLLGQTVAHKPEGDSIPIGEDAAASRPSDVVPDRIAVLISELNARGCCIL